MKPPRIRVLGRKGNRPFGVVNALDAQNAAVAAGEQPVIWLRRIAQAMAFTWNRNYHPDWDFRVEEKEV